MQHYVIHCSWKKDASGRPVSRDPVSDVAVTFVDGHMITESLDAMGRSSRKKVE